MMRGGGTLSLFATGLAAVCGAASGPPLAAQERWNGGRALELVERARSLRQGTVGEGGLQSYAADARGYVYFFVDHDESDEQNLVKTDQVALEVFWQAPNRGRQRIVGLRDEKQLPTSIQYHLDHLTVVQDDFGDRIRLGDGDEVSEVLHPLAPGSEAVYDFALGDSLSLRFAGLPEPIRVYELRVRPRNLDDPGFVGTVFVDRASAAVVRMRFTFTPSSYVDPYLDYIRISLDNALWDGRYWLPYQQRVEIRRELPVFDFPLGSVIRGRYTISGYRLNEPLPLSLFQGPRVTALPEPTRRAFPFERDLYADLEAEGLGPAPDLDEIRAQAVDLAQRRYLGGLRPLRLYVPGASSALRYNRAEGTVLGAGLSYRPHSALELRVSGGYALGRDVGQLHLDVRGGERRPESRIEAYVQQPRDIGPVSAASGVVNTLSGLTGERDYQDLYFASGVRMTQGFGGDSPWRLSFAARWERHATAEDVVSPPGGSEFRPVLPTREGDLLSLDLEGRWSASSALAIGAAVQAAHLDGDAFGVVRADAHWARQWLRVRRAVLDVHLRAGLASIGAPPQAMFLLGGRGTLPGYDFRSFAGTRFWLGRADATMALAWPWISAHAFAAVGSTARGGALPEGWRADTRDRPRVSVGGGLDVLWDVLRLEAGRGLAGGGDWELNLFASARFWPVL